MPQGLWVRIPQGVPHIYKKILALTSAWCYNKTMANYVWSDRFFSTLSWLVVLGLFVAATGIWLAPPSGAGPIAGWLGIKGAQYFYMFLYGSEAAALMIAKFFRNKRARKNVLMVVYLTGFFTSLMSILIGGFSPKIIDNLLVAIGAAACWLYWKFKTEYVDPKVIQNETLELRSDLPPAIQRRY